MSNVSNKKLVIIFTVLLIIVAVMFFTNIGKNERTFRDELVDIDTADISLIKLYPKSSVNNEVSLINNDGVWSVKLSEDKYSRIPPNKIKSLIDQIVNIKPKRLAARSKDKWKDFQVDSSSTRIEVYENDDKVLDLIIGRFVFQQPRSMSTFVRLVNDLNVYEVDGFLEMSFNQKADAFRDGTILNDEYSNWERLTFDYPADSSFQIMKENEKWISISSVLDSAKVENYLRSISALSGSKYNDSFASDYFSGVEYKLALTSDKLGDISVAASKIDSTGYLIFSDMNPENVIYDSDGSIFKKLFIGMKALINN